MVTVVAVTQVLLVIVARPLCLYSSLTKSVDYFGIGFLPCMTMLQSSCMLLASLSEHASTMLI